MLEKLDTHDIQDVSALFSLADNCAKAAEGRAWHSPVAQTVKGESKPNNRTQAHGSGSGNDNANKKKKKKKKAGGSVKCSVHNSMRHSVLECWEIKKLAE
jgi:hypothetical protein